MRDKNSHLGELEEIQSTWKVTCTWDKVGIDRSVSSKVPDPELCFNAWFHFRFVGKGEVIIDVKKVSTSVLHFRKIILLHYEQSIETGFLWWEEVLEIGDKLHTKAVTWILVRGDHFLKNSCTVGIEKKVQVFARNKLQGLVMAWM